MSDVVHLSKWCCHDEDETWCGAAWPYERAIADATCIPCMRAAAAYGHEAYKREAELLGLSPVENWEARARLLERLLELACNDDDLGSPLVSRLRNEGWNAP